MRGCGTEDGWQPALDCKYLGTHSAAMVARRTLFLRTRERSRLEGQEHFYPKLFCSAPLVQWTEGNWKDSKRVSCTPQWEPAGAAGDTTPGNGNEGATSDPSSSSPQGHDEDMSSPAFPGGCPTPRSCRARGSVSQ